MAANEEVTMMMSVLPGAMTGINDEWFSIY